MSTGYRVVFRSEQDLDEILAATLPTYAEACVFAEAIAWLSPRIEAPTSPQIRVLDERAPASPQRPHRGARLASA